jgi:hypothetical protein
VVKSAKKKYKVSSKVVPYPGMDAWYFAYVDKKLSGELKEKFGKGARGFGSLPVEVTLGKTKWKTSIFPDKHSGVYLLPLKAKIRRAEGIAAGDTITFILNIQV